MNRSQDRTPSSLAVKSSVKSSVKKRSNKFDTPLKRNQTEDELQEYSKEGIVNVSSKRPSSGVKDFRPDPTMSTP
jgi:hypothetical protein